MPLHEFHESEEPFVHQPYAARMCARLDVAIQLVYLALLESKKFAFILVSQYLVQTLTDCEMNQDWQSRRHEIGCVGVLTNIVHKSVKVRLEAFHGLQLLAMVTLYARELVVPRVVLPAFLRHFTYCLVKKLLDTGFVFYHVGGCRRHPSVYCLCRGFVLFRACVDCVEVLVKSSDELGVVLGYRFLKRPNPVVLSRSICRRCKLLALHPSNPAL